MLTKLFWFWTIFNLFIGIWELYAFSNRDKLSLSNDTLWNKIKNGTTTFKTFWIDAWIEYCKVDSRYIKKYSPLEYVWGFEICNFILATLLFIVVIYITINIQNKNIQIKNIQIKNTLNIIKIILLLSIVNCFLYFLTLGIEICSEIYNNTNNTILENIKLYASRWNLLIYYLISSIWLIIPFILYRSI